MKEVLVIDRIERENFWLNLNCNHRILFAASASEGLSKLSENVGLVFLNLRLLDSNGVFFNLKLLDSNGLEVLRLIKKAYPSIEIILITSCMTDEHCMAAFRRGVSDYVKKPLDAEEILQKIQTLISTNDVSQKKRHAPLPTESANLEQHPDKILQNIKTLISKNEVSPKEQQTPLPAKNVNSEQVPDVQANVNTGDACPGKRHGPLLNVTVNPGYCSSVPTHLNTNDDSLNKNQTSPSAAENVKTEHYSNIPSHLLKGVLTVRDFIVQNYSESLSLEAACKMASTSKTYFCRFFKLITGYSLRTYHHIVKMRVAEQLLRDKRMSITDIAQRLGYDDSNYFSTIYKRITEYSPREWQASYKSLYMGREETGKPEVVPKKKSSRDRSESEHRNVMREWQDSYCFLYRERKKIGAAEASLGTKSSIIQKRIASTSPEYRETIVRSLDKLNEDMDYILGISY